MTLGQTQEKFSVMVQHLLTQAHLMGYNVRIGHVMRCQDCRTGKQNSLHKQKLAIDLNLFRDGKYLDKTEDHRELGEWWESIGGSWGGRFNESSPGAGDGNDGNHYSLAYGGMK